MDAQQVAVLRQILAASDWLGRTEEFACALRTCACRSADLLLVGTPTAEPWHMAAHLDDESRLNRIPELSPTLVRWSPPPGAPPHLSVGLERLESVRRGEALFVVAADAAPAPLLERVDDARRGGATILALDGGDRELSGLAHEALTVPSDEALLSFDGAQHLVSAAAGAAPQRRESLRDRLARLLEKITGPVTE